jgi:3'(2'), 5'-bisphosphate nucleotidase
MDTDRLWDELEDALLPMYQDYRRRLGSLQVEKKLDQTLLSEADLAVQERIVAIVRKADPKARFIAEETGIDRPATVEPVDSQIWIIDPIDGTREFLSPTGNEFCSVVCRLENLVPVAAFVLAPELARGSQALSIRVSGDSFVIRANGDDARRQAPRHSSPKLASVTRNAGDLERPWEPELSNAGYRMKVRTTSQTLDMVRTCVDLSGYTETPLQPFDLFYREAQKLWDGAAGLCLSRVTGRVAVDRHGASLLPISASLLESDEPTFGSTLVGPKDVIKWFLSKTADS